MFLSRAARYHTDHDMAAALRRVFRRAKPATVPVTKPVTKPATVPVTLRVTESRCPCTNLDEEQFPAVLHDAPRGEFDLPTAGGVEWLLFSYT